MSVKNNPIITREKYLLATCVKPAKLGEEFEEYPPHITHLSTFTMDGNLLPQFNKRMQGVADDWLPFPASAAGLYRFSDNSPEVMLVASIYLPALRAASLALKDVFGLDYDGTFVNRFLCRKDNSPPHISDWSEIKEGDRLNISQVELFISTGGMKKVIGVYTNTQLSCE